MTNSVNRLAVRSADLANRLRANLWGNLLGNLTSGQRGLAKSARLAIATSFWQLSWHALAKVNDVLQSNLAISRALAALFYYHRRRFGNAQQYDGGHHRARSHKHLIPG